MIRATLVAALALVIGCRAEEPPAPKELPPAPAGAIAGPVVVADAAAPAVPLAPAAVDALLEQALVMAQRLADVATSNAKDCGAMAGAIEALVAAQRPMLDELAHAGSDAATAKQIQAWMAAHATELDGAIARARPGLESCRSDPRIKSAFDHFVSRP